MVVAFTEAHLKGDEVGGTQILGKWVKPSDGKLKINFDVAVDEEWNAVGLVDVCCVGWKSNNFSPELTSRSCGGVGNQGCSN